MEKIGTMALSTVLILLAASSKAGTVQLYEAETTSLSGNSYIVGAADGSSRSIGDLAGEASGRQAVTMPGAGDGLSFVSTADANALVIRYSIPDASAGGGTQDTLGLSITGPDGSVLYPVPNTPVADLTLTSRYSWLYGTTTNPMGKLQNVPPTSIAYQTKLYDELQLQLGQTIPAGSTFTFKNKTTAGNAFTIDFVELESVPDPIAQPPGFLSLTTDCAVVASATNALGQNTLTNTFNYVFSGVDDILFPGSTFNAYTGPNPAPINPINDPDYQALEMDYYTSSQDAAMTSLANANAAKLSACLSRVAQSNGQYVGIYIPVGRYYMNGAINLPNNAYLQGAGMWYSKLVAINTGAPQPVTINNVAGVQGATGNLTFVAANGSSDQVVLSDFSMFGNVTQRDTLDNLTPVAVNGQFTNSSFNNLWIEHYLVGLQMTGNSLRDIYNNSRVRNTFADGLDFFGATSLSTVVNSSTRGTGDDGIAFWSQTGTGISAPGLNNSASNCSVSLNWYGNGMAVYGGQNNLFSSSTVDDTLTSTCLELGSESSPYPVTEMSAAADNLTLTRCGGTVGAIHGVYDSNVISHIYLNFESLQIYSPSYSAIDLRDLNSSSPDTPVLDAIFSNVSVLNEPLNTPCISLAGSLKGSLQLSDTYSCSSNNALAVTCQAQGTSKFPVTSIPVSPGTLCDM